MGRVRIPKFPRTLRLFEFEMFILNFFQRALLGSEVHDPNNNNGSLGALGSGNNSNAIMEASGNDDNGSEKGR